MTHNSRLTIWIFAVLLPCVLVPNAAASSDEDELDPVGHSADSYYLDFSPFGKLELPRLFVVKEEGGGYGFKAFLSSTSAVESGYFDPRFEDETDAEITAAEEEAGHGAEDGDHGEAQEARTDYYYAKLVPPEGHAVVVDMSITKHLVFAWLGALIVFLIFTRLARMYKAGTGRESAPKGTFQNMFETLVLFVRDDIARPTIGAKADRYVPYLLTAFFFILTCNLLG
ncbi:MAG: F0F1 ATP synthase subunit A, partial [Rhodothermales bacterium]|nr:F0F1 ATP synthase subunit A [Rhodothermales bacterium]